MESVSTRNIDVNINENKKNEISSYGNTLVEAFRNTVSKYAEKPVLHYKKNDKWEHYTFTQTHEICMQVAKAITHLNIPVKSAVNIIGFNSCEWFFSAVGALIAGDVITGVYATNNSSVCEYVADNSSASLVICDGIKQLQKYIPIVEKLKALVVYNVETIPEDIKSKVKIPIYTFNEFIEIGKDISIDKVNERTNQIKPSDLCSLIYTSGTTGNPKGVMLSHENILSTVDTVISDIDGVTNDDCLVSYLPLSHVAAQLLDIHAPICVGLQVYIADPDALRGTLGATIKEAKPTIFFGVPRVYEKIMEKMVSASEKMHGIKKRLAEWSASKGLQKARLQEYGKSGGAPCGYGCANALVLSKVREILGFQNARFMITSAAPIRPEVIDFFASYDLYLYELYGESETCGPISYNIPGKWKIGSVGRGMRSMDIKIDPNTGELLCKGRNIMMGYFKNEKATKETIDENGYLHTGDIASIDEDGFLHITGRIKELIITAGGENIGPGSIEDSIKEALPELANAILIGDHRKYLTVLFTFATELDEQGAPTSKLTEKTLNDCKRLGSKATTIEELKKCEIWKKHLDEGLKKANENAASRACTVQKYTILDRDFSVATEELTPTLKVRRSIIAKKYKDVIEKMYAEEKK